MDAPAADLPTTEALAAALPTDAPRRRRDGWTPPRQRAFLEAIVAGCTIRVACGRVGLSPASLYAFRNSPAGRGFALGWDAASLRARGALQDLAVARVVDGYEERVTRSNGEVIVRHRHDNGLLMRVLDRLDRHAAFDGPGTLAAARTIESDFGRYLDGICAPGDREEVSADAGLADLVLADRDEWTADQWRRAEAAGLLSFAAPAGHASTGDQVERPASADETAFEHQLVQHRGEALPGQGGDFGTEASDSVTALDDEVEQPHAPHNRAFERQLVQHRAEPQPERQGDSGALAADSIAAAGTPSIFTRSGQLLPDQHEGAALAGAPTFANRAARRASAAKGRRKNLIPRIARRATTSRAHAA